MSDVSAHPSTPSRRRGRRRGVEIRPGSVKQARQESGLSLGQVARGDLSRTAIYFVETGKAKPSIETLRLIAERTNKPLEFFLGEFGAATADPMAALADIERFLSTGEPASAAEAAEKLIAATPDAGVAARARVHLALAYIRLGHNVRGRSEAAVARAYFQQTNDRAMAAEAMGYEAGAANNMQDPSGISLAREALALCRAVIPVPRSLESRLLFILGHAFGQRHEYEKAVDALEESIAAGSTVQDLRQLSIVYSNLSLNHQELGHFAEAARYSRRAMAIHETLQDRRLIAVGENNLALLLFLQGDLAGAFRHAERSVQILDETGNDTGKAHHLMTMAELELARSHIDEASRYAEMAIEVAERMGETANVGEAHAWRGRIAAAQEDDATADAEFEAAFELFEVAEAPERKTRNRAIYADILEARGDLAGANRQLRLALAVVRPSVVAFMDTRTATA